MQPHLRAADADRLQVIDALHRHTADGRLSLDEFTARLDAVNRSTTYGELAAVTADLPTQASRRRTTPGLMTSTVMISAVLLVIVLATAVVAVLAGWGHLNPMMASMSTAIGPGCR